MRGFLRVQGKVVVCWHVVWSGVEWYETFFGRGGWGFYFLLSLDGEGSLVVRGVMAGVVSLRTYVRSYVPT